MLMTKYILTLAIALSASCFVATEARAEMAVELIEVEQQTPQVTVVDNNIRVTGGQSLTLYVYNVAGVCIHTVKIDSQDKKLDLNLPKGCYIIKVGKTARKISIK